MKKCDLIVDTKGLKKAAIAIGFGLVVGKAIGDFTTNFIASTFVGLLKYVKNNSKQSEFKQESNSKVDDIRNDSKQ